MVSAVRTCRSCGLPKAEADFPLRADAPDGRRGTCKLCRRAYAIEHYRTNRDIYLGTAQKNRPKEMVRRRIRLHDVLWRLKDVPCSDC